MVRWGKGGGGGGGGGVLTSKKKTIGLIKIKYTSSVEKANSKVS